MELAGARGYGCNETLGVLRCVWCTYVREKNALFLKYEDDHKTKLNLSAGKVLGLRKNFEFEHGRQRPDQGEASMEMEGKLWVENDRGGRTQGGEHIRRRRSVRDESGSCLAVSRDADGSFLLSCSKESSFEIQTSTFKKLNLGGVWGV